MFGIDYANSLSPAIMRASRQARRRRIFSERRAHIERRCGRSWKRCLNRSTQIKQIECGTRCVYIRVHMNAPQQQLPPANISMKTPFSDEFSMTRERRIKTASETERNNVRTISFRRQQQRLIKANELPLHAPIESILKHRRRIGSSCSPSKFESIADGRMKIAILSCSFIMEQLLLATDDTERSPGWKCTLPNSRTSGQNSCGQRK